MDWRPCGCECLHVLAAHGTNVLVRGRKLQRARNLADRCDSIDYDETCAASARMGRGRDRAGTIPRRRRNRRWKSLACPRSIVQAGGLEPGSTDPHADATTRRVRLHESGRVLPAHRLSAPARGLRRSGHRLLGCGRLDASFRRSLVPWNDPTRRSGNPSDRLALRRARHPFRATRCIAGAASPSAPRTLRAGGGPRRARLSPALARDRLRSNTSPLPLRPRWRRSSGRLPG